MNIPLLDLRRDMIEIQDEIFLGLREIFKSMKILNGPYLQSFERAWADYLGVKFAYGCSCGTSALIMALLALGIGKGDEVLVQTNAFIADFEAIYFSGA
ncbi:MAG: DegT/DnrJ/EryC1/StrS family aminotransferase, partial [Caldimicrobium sp.]